MARSPSRRDDDRYARDRRDDRDHRRRSRSRTRDRRYDDGDGHRRRDRDYGRLTYDREYERTRSRDRKRSREASPGSVRDRRPVSRRDDRDHYDDRDRKKSRRDDDYSRPRRDEDYSRSSRPAGERDHRQSRAPGPRGNESPHSTSVEDPAEAERQAKLAKVAAWKKKMEVKKRLEADAATKRTEPLQVQGEAASPSGSSPAVASPSAVASTSPSAEVDDAKPVTPVAYAGKFDHKAIAKRAAAAMEKQRAKLGGDVVIPKSANDINNTNSTTLADDSKYAVRSGGRNYTNSANTSAKITGFGLNKAPAEKEDRSSVSKPVATLDEEDDVERKLEKLPDMPSEPLSGDAALANDEDDQAIGDDMQSDEDEAEAAREAAQKRAEEAQAEPQDVVMTDGEIAPESVNQSQTNPPTTDKDEMEEDEEVDPLDAFMSGLEQPKSNDMPNLAIGKSNKPQRQVFNSDDEEADRDAVGEGTGDLLALAAKRKKKELPTVNHGTITYEPFRKQFYSESVELSEMTQEDVDIMRANMDNITCRGTSVPKPITKWSQGGFGAQLLDVIQDQKFESPTSIQSQALPAIMSGRDVIGVAKTGSGKTVAFILPMFRHIKDQRPLDNLDGPIGLILAPTRELATQIHRECKPYLKALNLRGVCAYGGAPIKDQIAELKRGAEVVVCTPGRMIDLLTSNAGRVTNLRRVTYLVLDEADRMFDMGFEPQITKIMNNIRPQRQTVLFSATFPRTMEALARKALTKPIEITVGGRSVVAAEVTQKVEVVTENAKFTRLLELLGQLYGDDDDVRTLIFVERQESADQMLKDLLHKGYPSHSIHGGREQVDRDFAIQQFKAGLTPVMVATSVAARGLDVKELKLVVNYDSPNHIEDYVHRCGRTGRAGNTGTAVTFVTPDQDRFASFLIKALTDSKQEIPDDLQQLKEAHQEKVKAGDAKKAGSGFGGRGIERFDASRDAERAVQRKVYKTGDEPEEEDGEKTEKTDDKQSEVDKLVAKATGGIKDRDAVPDKPAASEKPAASTAEELPTTLANHLSKAMKVQKAASPPPKPAAGVASNSKASSAAAKAAEAAAKINSRLGAKGSTRPGMPIDNHGPDAGAFHATLEINDFPQKARWGVTNRTNVAKILEGTGTSITSKGIFYKQGEEPKPGEQPKLYILVEGDTEMAVQDAMGQLTRLLRDGAVAAMEEESRGGGAGGGRYKVT